MKKLLIFFLLTLCVLSSCAEGDMNFDASMLDSNEVWNGETEQVENMKKEFVIHPRVLSMTIEEKVGQLFLARCPERNPIEDVKKYNLGGYILFARDFEEKTPEIVTKNISSYQNAANIPLLIAVDEEGGDVCRVSKYENFRDNNFLSPRTIFKLGGMERLKADEAEKSLLLKSLGINVNMAPVCDISTDKNAFMYKRSLGQGVDLISEFVSYVVSVNNSNKVGSVLKHFPGYGNNGDTHTGIIVDNRPLSDFENFDLIPFKKGIESGAPAILVSHTIVNCFDSEMPISLSVNAHNYLRDVLKFEGVIITDDLVMKAIKDKYGIEEAAVLAVLAGNDILCSTEYEKQYNAVIEAVKNGRISLDIIDKAVSRVLYLKEKLGLM